MENQASMSVSSKHRDDPPGGGREETASELLRRAGRAGGIKRTHNLWRREAKRLGISLEEYIALREQADAKNAAIVAEKKARWAQEREEAKRLGVSVAWYRSE